VSAGLVTLRGERVELALCPAVGGAVAGLRWRHPTAGWFDLLRPTDPADLARGDVVAAACFALTPYSNRLRDGRTTFRGAAIRLPSDPQNPHAEHGHGWHRPWQAALQDVDRATLRYQHAPDAWPFAYWMEQRFRLLPDGLEIEIAARNEHRHVMPYGFGIHPYFPKTAGARLAAEVTGFWETDAEVMPTRHLAPPAHADPRAGIAVAASDLDNCFTGWNGRSTIDWPERRTRLVMSATPPLRFLVVFTPPAEPYFCAEPVSNATDAFNLAASRGDTGMLVLEPGEMVTATVTFTAAATG
jgi:aldose 1-epimerase